MVRMHILLIHRAFAQPDQPGGTRHIELARELAGRGDHVTVVTSKVSYLLSAGEGQAELPGRETLEAGIEVIRCASGMGGRSFASRLREMFGFMFQAFWAGFRHEPIDVVWATSPTLFQALAATLVAKLKRKPLLLEIRDMWPDALVDIGALKNPIAIRLARGLARWLYRQATVIVINSPGFRPQLLKEGAPEGKIHLVPNGVDTRMFLPEDRGEEGRARFGWTDRFVCLYSGAHGMANDLDTLLETARQLEPLPQVLIALMGDGPEKKRLQAKAQEMGLRNIEFIPAQPKKAMADMLAASDCCIAHLVPSKMQAMVYPNKVFDYMAAGRPTVLGIGGVIREVIEAAGGGLPVAPGDAPGLAAAIRTLAEDPQLGRKMGMDARRYVEEHFQRATLAQSLFTALDACVAEAHR